MVKTLQSYATINHACHTPRPAESVRGSGALGILRWVWNLSCDLYKLETMIMNYYVSVKKCLAIALAGSLIRLGGAKILP